MPVAFEKQPNAALAVAIISAAIVLAGGILGPRPAFAFLCHQHPERSFIVDGHLFAVCHRCTGIYAGLLIGLLSTAVPFVRHAARRFALGCLGIAIALVIFDIGLDAAGIVSSTAGSRVITGLLLGFGGGSFLGAAVLSMDAHPASKADFQITENPYPQPETDNR